MVLVTKNEFIVREHIRYNMYQTGNIIIQNDRRLISPPQLQSIPLSLDLFVAFPFLSLSAPSIKEIEIYSVRR